MSGAVGSIPSFTRSGRPSFAAWASLRSSSPAGSESTAFRSRNEAVSRALELGVATEANARLSLRPDRVSASERQPASGRRRAAELLYDGLRPWPPGPLFMADDQL